MGNIVSMSCFLECTGLTDNRVLPTLLVITTRASSCELTRFLYYCDTVYALVYIHTSHPSATHFPDTQQASRVMHRTYKHTRYCHKPGGKE
ncbi:hypothetical protein E2C01_017476 [Portunus trituberculatus]|uniref:Uncharacterized protein n=1 Tax=Portunus trituberculatus TaxID=210409 RepID=A0A5B7DSZ1_PORTR|nr:hypothetical protein [Portunus trituberculatus]